LLYIANGWPTMPLLVMIIMKKYLSYRHDIFSGLDNTIVTCIDRTQSKRVGFVANILYNLGVPIYLPMTFCDSHILYTSWIFFIVVLILLFTRVLF